ncbi:MAG: hypothetical protein DMF80_14670 [Acidobacteria bacterium]|nr:MAG: hypothetical protein DMF80_14670 [Acidobacteriota bacterium]
MVSDPGPDGGKSSVAAAGAVPGASVRPARPEPSPAGEAPALTPARLAELLERYGDHPSIGLVLNAGMEYFTDRSAAGLIAYRRAGRYLFQFGGVFGPPEAKPALLRAFLESARARGERVCAVQLRDSEVDMYHRHGFRMNQLGLSYTVSLAEFNTRGTRFMKLRNKIKRAKGLGIEVRELGRDLPITAKVRQDLDAITQAWVRAKGRHKKVLEFLVGEIDAVEREGTRCFVALREEKVIAFITYVPSYGRLAGLMHDLSRRLPDCPPGVMELINLTAIERFQSEGVRYLNFGLTPFVGVSDVLGSHSRVVAWVVRLLERHGEAIYPAMSQVAYKQKWSPQIIEPEYFAFQGRFRLGCLWQLLRLTRSV